MQTTHHLARILTSTLILASLTLHAQTPATTAPTQQPATSTQQPEVLFQSHGAPPTTPEDTTEPALRHAEPTGPPLTDAQRSDLLFTAYDLDARINPDASHLSMRARVTLRNTGSQPLARIPLQISSALVWDSAALIAPTGTLPLPLAQHLIDTDADHTGRASEVILTLPTPLPPGATITLDTVYSGTISVDAARLKRIGAPASQALDTDWDTIGSGSDATSSSSSDPAPATLIAALRGFGNVLWYPVAAPQLFLGDGAKLFQAVGKLRLAEEASTIHLRLAVEYKGAPPVAAFFCSRRLPLTAIPDDPTAPAGSQTGLATADFPPAPLGFRQPSLFVIQLPETLLAPLPQPVSSSSEPSTTPAETPASTTAPDAPILAVETTDTATLPRLAASTEAIAPLLQKWFGEHPLTPLTILDHAGEPFEDGPLLVAPIAAIASTSSSPALAHSLTHAWVQTGQPWFDEGLAQFVSLLWIEQVQGRDAALLQLNNLIQPLDIAEPGFDSQQAADAASASTGQPLVAATDELYYRRKAAAVWWMLRAITGDHPLQQALTDWRNQPFSHDDPTIQAIGFEKLLEKTSGKDLSWFFSDWVLRDRGLPDLSITAVEPRQLPAGKGHDSGWLVSVTVHNDGAPAVEVPLTITSGSFTTTKRILIHGFSNTTDRIFSEAPPTQVILNDGGTPEIGASTHSRQIVTDKPQPLLQP
ncbi:MAG: M1 family metallopeptidase [Acidobacteria bacterium]|nr:M1 family metallopeptidase [Acidobacteriota bacterium]